MRLGRVEVSAGCLLLLAWLNYWDTQGVVPLALAACLLHELAHYGALRLAGAALLAAGVCFFCLGGNVTLLLVALWIGAGTIPLKKSGNRACHMGWKRVQ